MAGESNGEIIGEKQIHSPQPSTASNAILVMPVCIGITCASMWLMPSGKIATRPFCFNRADIASKAPRLAGGRGAPATGAGASCDGYMCDTDAHVIQEHMRYRCTCHTGTYVIHKNTPTMPHKNTRHLRSVNGDCASPAQQRAHDGQLEQRGLAHEADGEVGHSHEDSVTVWGLGFGVEGLGFGV